MFSGRSGAARLSMVVVIGLIVIKVAVGAVTGSLSVLAQAVDSFLDLFAVVITFLAVRIATMPADEEHPFGHGKAENIAAIVQSVLIFFASVAIIYSAVRRIQTGATLELTEVGIGVMAVSIIYSAVRRVQYGAVLEMTEAGIGVMAVSIIASIFLSRHLRRVARQEDSPALEANAKNIAADVYSAAAVFIGLLLVRFTNYSIIDTILALLVALYILKVAYDMLRNSFGGLIDVKLPDDEEKIIKTTIKEHIGQVVDFHALRTRKAGSQHYIDLHLVLPKDMSIEKAHDICDHLEADIESSLPRTDVTIHVEPCDENCDQCDATCESRKG